ncbi:MAG: hypothetical protein ATN36_01075 [Epulopiscium sp. Nele67-Bin005]|nr:MAG: hypothetical protein ATN36_01075 [Epulopiscium sp. Nele67-Bin005]
MKVQDIAIVDLIEGNNKNFIIPLYQRNYNWKIEHCNRLLDDIQDIIKNDYNNHFLGSVVSFTTNRQEVLIIDGQQRITTISLLLLAICHVLEDKYLEMDNTDKLIDEIMFYYLQNRNPRNEDDKIKLKPIKDDKKAYEALFKKKNFIKNCNITTNYEFFYEFFKDGLEEKSLENLKLFYNTTIRKLKIVDIELASEDDPQLIFESLNSTGLDLTEADRIRNFLLLKQSPQQQEELYTDYWYEIEKNVNNETSEFIRHYLTFKMGDIPKKAKVYIVFKKYVERNKLSAKDILKNLHQFSVYYKNIINANYFDSNPIIANIGYLNKLKLNVSYPFLLGLFDDYEEQIISKIEFINILEILQSYILRRNICGVATNSLNTTFATLHKEMKNKQKNIGKSYDRAIAEILCGKTGTGRFPEDEEFKKSLSTKNLYRLKDSKECLFHVLETFDKRETINVIELMKRDKEALSIEHIMPQTLTAEWKKTLGAKYRDIHSQYVNTLGNLTLTGYNSKLSNHSFIEKRDMKNGFRESTLYLNKYLATLDTWNEEEIKKRSKILIDRCISIWKYPKVSHLQKNSCDQYYLSDDIDFTNVTVKNFTFNNREYTVASWVDFLSKFCRQLYSIDNVLLAEIADGKHKNLTQLISTNPSNLNRPVEICDNIFIETKNSTNIKLDIMRKLAYEFDIDKNDISFYVIS